MSQLTEELANGVASIAITAMMMMVMVYRGGLRLQFFLEEGKVLLRGGEVTGFEIRRELIEILCDRAAALRRRTRTRLTLRRLQRGDVCPPTARVWGFFWTYRRIFPVSRDVLRDIARQYHNWVRNRSQKWKVEIVERIQEDRRDRFAELYFERTQHPIKW